MMDIMRLQLMALRGFCLSLIGLIDMILATEEKGVALESPEVVQGCRHLDVHEIPTMGGGIKQRICRGCGEILGNEITT